MTGWLLDPFQADFMVRAGLGVLLLGVAAPLCGCRIVQRRLVYLSDAMSHAVLAGVAGAALVGASLLVSAFVAAVVMALGVAALVLRTGIAEDAAIGVSGQTLFALGLVGVSFQRDDPRALSHVLFGSPLTTTWSDVALQAGLAGTVALASYVLLPVLVATTFDGVHARTVGIRVGLVDTLLVVGLGLVVVIGLTTVGVLMAVSMLVLPAVAARLPPGPADRARGRARGSRPGTARRGGAPHAAGPCAAPWWLTLRDTADSRPPADAQRAVSCRCLPALRAVTADRCL